MDLGVYCRCFFLDSMYFIFVVSRGLGFWKGGGSLELELKEFYVVVGGEWVF